MPREGACRVSSDRSAQGVTLAVRVVTGRKRAGQQLVSVCLHQTDLRLCLLAWAADLAPYVPSSPFM